MRRSRDTSLRATAVRRKLPADDIHVFLTSGDVALHRPAGLGPSGDAAKAGELELAGQ